LSKGESLLNLLNKRRAALGNPQGWDWVIEDPVVTSLAPSLHFLEKEGLIELSDQLKEHSTALYWHLAAFWIRREQQLKSILQMFAEEDIDVIPLKGAALLESVYKRIGLRYMGDVDLLVRNGDFIQASRILIDLGLQPHWSSESGDLFGFTQLPSQFWPGELSFTGLSKLHIDLHRDLVTNHWFKTGFPVDMDEVWKRSTAPDISSDKAQEDTLWEKMLSPYDMLAHICLHIAMDGLGMMKNFLDVDLWLRNLPENWEWEKYLDLVKRWKTRSVSFHVFSFCQEFFETPVPSEVMTVIKPAWYDRILVKALISPRIILENRINLGRRYPTLVKFALFDGMRTKWKVIRNLVFPDRSWLKAHPDYHNLRDHWAHVYQVIARGD
jgi:hypothetical protein